jgi:D-serine deaminase-like pyridoxal phosphate-dependent protein
MMRKKELSIAGAYMQGAPATVGDALAKVDTPALPVDLNAFNGNLARVHARILQAGLQVRPHGKAHKTQNRMALAHTLVSRPA